MDVIKVNTLESIGDSKQGCLHVSDGGLGYIGRITFSIPSKHCGYQPIEHGFTKENPPPSNPNGLPSVYSGKSAEEMLKKALEYAYQGMNENKLSPYNTDDYHDGQYYAYEDMAAHLEILIKEAKNA